MQAQDLMTRDPATVSPDDTAQRVAQVMDECDCGIVPVLDRNDNNRLIGVVTDRDIAIRGVGRGLGADAPVRDIMTVDVASCAPDADISEVERTMTDRQIRRVVIADADGVCVGIIAQADLARASQSGAVRDTEVADVVQKISEPG